MKYQNVLQHNEEDCGAACLASIAKHYGRIFSISHIREAVGTGQLGTTLLGLMRGAESLGFNARSVKVASEILDRVDEFPLPAIIHWKGCHYVVFYGKQGRKYVIADPSVGLRFLERNELESSWTGGVTLLLEPDPVRFSGQPEDKIAGFGRFFKPVRSYRHILAQAVLINLVLGLLSLALPFLIQVLTDDVLVRGDRPLLTQIVLAVVVMQSMSSSLQWIQDTLIAHFAQRLELGLVLEFGRKLLRLPLAYYESHRSGEIVSRLRDIEDINQLIAQVLVDLPSQLFVALVSLGLMLFYSHKLAIVAIGFALFMSLSTIIVLPTLRQRVRQLLVLEAENQGVLVETFKGALTLKTTTAAVQFWEEFQSRFGRLAHVTFRTIQLGIINRTFSVFVSNLGNIILLWFGSHLVIAQELSIGQLLAFNSLNANFLAFVSLIIYFVDDFIRVNAAVERLTEVIDATPENQGDLKKPWVNISDKADIVCQQLNYHYPGRLDLLTDFSLTIPGGQVTAIIGRSGCGKSTLAKLIANLYTLKSGNLRIGIYNLQDLPLDCLRQQIVLIPQEAHFWSRSILENFRLGSPQASFEQIVRACQIAGADEFISQLPDKYQTVLGEFGANLSGGQRQRLAIARAMVNQPAILILDESTAALDPISEAEVLDNLLEQRQGKTTLVISHRPSAIQRADWLVFLEQGRLKQEGSLKTLRQQAGSHLAFLNHETL
jgi:ATP-binding cassette subfamily C protein